MTFIIKNNTIYLEKQLNIPWRDRSFRYGDGCFETIKILNKKALFLDEHLLRLRESLNYLNIQLDLSPIRKNVHELIQLNGINEGILRIICSRGESWSSYRPIQNTSAFYLVTTDHSVFQRPERIILGISDQRKASLNALPMHLKINSALSQVLVWKNDSDLFFDKIMCDENGYVSSCSSTNIFWKKKQRFFSPSHEHSALKGITIQQINQQFGLEIEMASYRLEDLEDAEHVYICNSGIQVLSVSEIIGKQHSFTYKVDKDLEEKYLKYIHRLEY